MPRLIFAIDRDSLKVDVMVGLKGHTTTALIAAGQPIPAPIRGRGVIDTGSNVTSVRGAILRQLGAPIQLQSNTQTASASVPVDLYEISLGIRNFADPYSPHFAESTLLVMEIPGTIPDVDVLVGLDVLMNCKMTLDGPGQQLVLEF